MIETKQTFCLVIYLFFVFFALPMIRVLRAGSGHLRWSGLPLKLLHRKRKRGYS